ncbi:hypothetical protein BQ8420_26175 [Nocardiopsis sp. JB363]|nr:hypothetical protein BQ8420_26175 [Nocardiopsis sp. JB363]
MTSHSFPHGVVYGRISYRGMNRYGEGWYGVIRTYRFDSGARRTDECYWWEPYSKPQTE